MVEDPPQRTFSEVTLRELLDVPELPLKRGDAVYVGWLDGSKFIALACTVTGRRGDRIFLRQNQPEALPGEGLSRRKRHAVVLERLIGQINCPDPRLGAKVGFRVVQAKGRTMAYGRPATLLPLNEESRDHLNSLWAITGAVKSALAAIDELRTRIRFGEPAFATNEFMNSSEARMARIASAARELLAALGALLDEERGVSA